MGACISVRATEPNGRAADPATPAVNPFDVFGSIAHEAQMRFLSCLPAATKRALRRVCKRARVLTDEHITCLGLPLDTRGFNMVAALQRVHRSMPRCASLTLMAKRERGTHCRDTLPTLAAQQAPLPSVTSLGLTLSIIGATPTLQQQQQQLGTVLAAAFPNLERLVLHGRKIPTFGPDVLASLAALPRLCDLSIPAGMYDDEAITQLRGLTRLHVWRHDRGTYNYSICGHNYVPPDQNNSLAAVHWINSIFHISPAAPGLLYNPHSPSSPPRGLHSLPALKELWVPGLFDFSRNNPQSLSSIALPPTVLRLNCNFDYTDSLFDTKSLYQYMVGPRSACHGRGWLQLDLQQQSLEMRHVCTEVWSLAPIVRYFNTVAGLRQVLVDCLNIDMDSGPFIIPYLRDFVASIRSATGGADSTGLAQRQQQQQEEEDHPRQQQQQQQWRLVVTTLEIKLYRLVDLQRLRQALELLWEVEVLQEVVLLLGGAWKAPKIRRQAQELVLATGRVREVKVVKVLTPEEEVFAMAY